MSRLRPIAASPAVFGMCLVILAIAAWLLRAIPMQQSLWLDELHTSWTVSGTWSQVAGRAAEGNQGPLYFWFVWLLTHLLPANECSLRAVSWLSSGLFVFAIGWVTRLWTANASLGVLAALLATADPHAVYFGCEARPYAVVALLGLVHVVVFRQRLSTSARQGPAAKRARVVWIMLSWSLFYTHYTSILLLPAELCYAVVTPYRHRLAKAQVRRRWLIDLISIAVGCGLAGPQIWRIGARRDNWSQFVKPQSLTALWTIFPGGLYLFAPLIFALFLYLWLRDRPRALTIRRIRCLWPLLACWYLTPVGIAWLLTRMQLAPLLFRRYVWAASVPLFVHAALWGTLPVNRDARRAYLTAMLLLASLYWYRLPRETWTVHSREDWRSVASMIAGESATSSWPVLLRAGLIEDSQLSDDSPPAFREYCTFPFRGLYSLQTRPGPLVGLPSDRTGELSLATRQLLTSVPGVWYVHRGSPADARRVVDEWQQTLHGLDVPIEPGRERRFPGLTVFRITLSSGSEKGD